mmetsp:Transcript_23175/g.55043  ORF Transcript_23175/g.55043 Transcript_23175/m.55043 type:complete len:234 (-) Transcript_23175:285-986(-)
MVRPFIAAMESSTKPDSLIVSVWMVMAMSCLSANVSAVSITAGVVPQSSWSLRPAAPALMTSWSPVGSEVLPFPEKPKFRGNASVACSIIATWLGAGVQVVAFVPVAGPVPPPYIVVSPDATASSICCGHIQCTCMSSPPAVMIMPSPAIASVVTPTTIPSVTPSMMSGFPALPMPAIWLPLMPMSAFTMPSLASTINAFVMTTSKASLAGTPVACPMPSRSTFPPPNLHSSP